MFKIYKVKVKNQHNKKIKAVRSDCDGEYCDRYDGSGRCPGPFANFLQECGIVAQYTMPGTSHENGVAERRNRTQKDMVWSMIAHTTLPESLWSEALKTSVYLLNRVPSKIITKILYELWTEKSPSIQHFMFGVVQRKLGHIYHMRRSWTQG